MSAELLEQGFYTFGDNGEPLHAVLAPIGHFVGSNDAVVLEDFMYVDHRGRWHRVQSGMRTDGLTIRRVPRLLWYVTGSPYGKFLAAALVHDWYCVRALDLPEGPGGILRADGDRLFREMLEYLGANWVQRSGMFLAVASAGRISVK